MTTPVETSILVVDDEKLIRWSLKECLGKAGYHVNTVEDGSKALKAIKDEPYDLALVDYKLPDTNGLELLEKFQKQVPFLPVVMITAHSTIENAVAAMRSGASDYVTKPFQNEDILLRIDKVLENSRLKKVVAQQQEENTRRFSFDRVVGKSEAMRRVMELVERVVEIGDATVLISGESGTGKDVIAKAIHYNSPRTHGPYINITCTAIPETLLESILFGHERGAFTDAKVRKKGLLEEGNGGSVFLDEVGDMTMYLQGKLLRFLEEKTIQRVGGNREIPLDVRVIAATNRDLKKLVQDNQFREDLYFRLKVIPIHMPPLRERKEDIPLLVDHFIQEYNHEFKKSVRGLSPAMLKQLEDYHWPGNVRELKNTIERAMILGTGDTIDGEGLPMELLDDQSGGNNSPESAFKLTKKGINLDDLEEDFVRQALKLARGNQTRAGKLLGLNRDQIRYRIEKFKIDLASFAEA